MFLQRLPKRPRSPVFLLPEPNEQGVSPGEVAQLLQEDLAAIKEKLRNKKPLTEAEIKRLHAARIK
jgi:hypothetical protein